MIIKLRNILTVGLFCIFYFSYQIKAECNANFIFATTSGTTISFANTSTHNIEDDIQYFWDFGDGNISSNKNPIHTYSDPGLYIVTLNILTDANCFDKMTKQVNVGIAATSSDCILNIYFQTVNAGPPNYDNGEATVSGTGDYPGYYYPLWSNGSNHVTITNLEPGIYCVTVTKDFCYGSACVRISDNDFCQAEFDNEFRSFYETYTYYQFINLSQGEIQINHWDFGDGNESGEVSPVHFYSESGTYDVCLSIVSFSGCSDTFCKTIEVEDSDFYFGNITGEVYAGENLLPNGIAVLYEYNDEIFTAIDFTAINSGEYVFENILRMNKYITHIIPIFDVEEPYFPKYFPTYTFSETYWQDYELIDLMQEEFFTTNLASYGNYYYNNGSIEGRVEYTADSGFEEDVFGINWMDEISGNKSENGAANMVVFLLDENRNIINFSLTDADGYFFFEYLDYGTFYLKVEKAGLVSEEFNAIINESDPNISGILFTIIDEDIVLSNEKTEIFSEKISVFPNPVKNDLVILNKSNNAVNIRLINIQGQILYNDFLYENSKVLDFSAYPSGVYFIEIIGDGLIVNKKLIKF